MSDVLLLVVHMRTYQFDFISRYSRLSSILEIDLHLAQQAFRQVSIITLSQQFFIEVFQD